MNEFVSIGAINRISAVLNKFGYSYNTVVIVLSVIVLPKF